jgi:glyoxylase-like metal-dependent hydrolase (beta-lactamase superfamily II)
MRQLSPDVFVETGYRGANVAYVRTDEGLVFIDVPRRPRDARAWRQRALQLTGLEPRYVITTDGCSASVLNTCFFAPAPVIAHQATWEQIDGWTESQCNRVLDSWRSQYPEDAQDDERCRITRPCLTFTRRMTLVCGERTFSLFHLGGHSPAAIGVYLPREELFFSGQAFVRGRHPDMTEANSERWLRDLTQLRRMRIRTLVPGRGSLGSKDDTQALSAYLRLLRRRVRTHIRGGADKKEAVGNVDVTELLEFFPLDSAARSSAEKRIRASLRRVYQELQSAQSTQFASEE